MTRATQSPQESSPGATRRQFLQWGTAVAAASSLVNVAIPQVHAAEDTAASFVCTTAACRSLAAQPGIPTGKPATNSGQRGSGATTTVRAGSASVKLTDDNMAELRAEQKVFDRLWEGEFRANALVLDAGQKICLLSLDALTAPLDVTCRAASRIAAATGIPEDNILICATHTHTGHWTDDCFGSRPNTEFLRRMEEASVRAAVKAVAAIDGENPRAEATVLFGQSQEATVGRNSRLLLKDGSIGWYGYEQEDVIRPTGPYDPDLYVLALRRPDGAYSGLAFNHSVHNIGRIREDCMSPGFYGLAAQEIERRHGAIALYLPGAIGSTHNTTYNNSAVPAAECVHRVVDAVEEALDRLQPAIPGPITVVNRQFTYHVRRFDEAKEAAAVKSYLDRYLPKSGMLEACRKERESMAPHQGEARRLRLQVIRLGDLVFVGIPGELFARLGLEIRRRSPFRHTCIIGLANAYLGYIPDRKAYADGGYQTWAAWQCAMEVGTGEAIVDKAVAMLDELYDAAPPQRRGAS